MAKRIYIVRNMYAEPGTEPRLVRAHSQAQAIRHVARDFESEVAGQEDLVRAVGNGVVVETAGDEAEDKAPPTDN